jgi:hypothetical protein
MIRSERGLSRSRISTQAHAAGDTAVVPIASDIVLRSLSTGSLTAKIDVPALNLGAPSSPWWLLASDGSYIVIGSGDWYWVYGTSSQLSIFRIGSGTAA